MGVVQASPLSPPAPALPATATPALAPMTAHPPAAGHAAPVLRVRNEGPDVYVLNAAAAEEAVLLAPLGAVRARANRGRGTESFELSVRVGVGADEPVEVDAAGIQARFLSARVLRVILCRKIYRWCCAGGEGGGGVVRGNIVLRIFIALITTTMCR